MQAKISKFIAAVLALVIIFANSWSVVSYAAEVFLSEKELENQNTTSKDGSVDFDVQYTNGKHSATLNIDEKNTKLNIAVSLKKSGYVKDLAIDFSSSNFEVDQINDENTNENGNVTVNLYKSNKDIILEVKNDGDEIKKEDEQKIFERFYKIDESRNRNENRYGLGLAIAKDIVEKHNAKISASSKKGITTFKVTF